MNKSYIASPNVKGQIVIPKAIRNKFEVDENTQFLLSDDGENIILSPIDKVLTKKEKKRNYLDVLKETRGIGWVVNDADDLTRRKKELEESKKLREEW